MNKCKCGCGTLVAKNYKRGHGRRGKRNSAAHNEAIAIANSIRPRTEKELKHLRKLAEDQRGIKLSDELKKRISTTCKSNGVGKWMKGRKLSAEVRDKISESNMGRIVTDETRQKISKANTGINNGMYNVKHTNKIKQLISLASKRNWDNPEFKSKMLKYIKSDYHIQACRRGALITQKKLMYNGYHNTKPEQELKQILINNNINYIHGYSVWDIKHIYMADFYLPELNIIIEVDGTYWHDYPNGTEKDHLRNKEFLDNDYKIFRYWEGFINDKSVMNDINSNKTNNLFMHYYEKLATIEDK